MAIISTNATVSRSIVDFLNSKWRPPKACQVCGTNTWDVEANLAELRFLNLGAFFVGAPVVPLVVVTCRECGNTILINAIKAGWTAPTQPTAEAPSDMPGGVR